MNPHINRNQSGVQITAPLALPGAPQYQQLFISKDKYVRSHVAGSRSQPFVPLVNCSFVPGVGGEGWPVGAAGSQPGLTAGSTRRRGQCSWTCTGLLYILSDSHSKSAEEEETRSPVCLPLAVVGAQQEAPHVTPISASFTDEPPSSPSATSRPKKVRICIGNPHPLWLHQLVAGRADIEEEFQRSWRRKRDQVRRPWLF